MALYITRKFLRNADKNMSIKFIFVIVFTRMHIGSANNAPAHTLIVSNLEKSFPGDSYGVLNDTDTNWIRTRNGGKPQPGRTAPSLVDLTADSGSSGGVVATDIGRHFKGGNSSDARYIPLLKEECVILLEEYATISADFVYCALVSAKPLMFCETCVYKFVATITMYKEIEKMKECSDSLLSSDRVQILRETHNFLKRIWDKGSCEHCFTDMKSCERNVTQCAVREDVLTFQKYNNQTMECFAAKAASDEDVCLNCSHIYKKLSKFYVSMGNIEEVCIDCVEQMNSTRKEWSIVYNCTYSRKDVVSIVAISIFFCSLPLFFYVGSKVHTAKSEYKLVKQNRLTINKSNARARRPARVKIQPQSERSESFLTNDSTSGRI